MIKATHPETYSQIRYSSPGSLPWLCQEFNWTKIVSDTGVNIPYYLLVSLHHQLLIQSPGWVLLIDHLWAMHLHADYDGGVWETKCLSFQLL